MLDQLRATCKKLLEDGEVQVVIGYSAVGSGDAVTPVFIRDAAHVERLTWNANCYHNLVAYLTRPEVKALGRAAVVVKACDERALVMLQRESQLRREEVVVVGVACDEELRPLAAKCKSCENRVPRFADVVIGAASDTNVLPGLPLEPDDFFLEGTLYQHRVAPINHIQGG